MLTIINSEKTFGMTDVSYFAERKITRHICTFMYYIDVYLPLTDMGRCLAKEFNIISILAVTSNVRLFGSTTAIYEMKYHRAMSVYLDIRV